MAMKKYNEYLQVNPSFESVVDIAADSRNKNLWREYIVGDDMETILSSGKPAARVSVLVTSC